MNLQWSCLLSEKGLGQRPGPVHIGDVHTACAIAEIQRRNEQCRWKIGTLPALEKSPLLGPRISLGDPGVEKSATTAGTSTCHSVPDREVAGAGVWEFFSDRCSPQHRGVEHEPMPLPALQQLHPHARSEATETGAALSNGVTLNSRTSSAATVRIASYVGPRPCIVGYGSISDYRHARHSESLRTTRVSR